MILKSCIEFKSKREKHGYLPAKPVLKKSRLKRIISMGELGKAKDTSIFIFYDNFWIYGAF
jgi:hypothetical protein